MREYHSTLRPIGVFDSGLGGLTVLRALLKILPMERFFYVGDTARVPSGTKSKETIERFSLEIAHFLLKHNVKMIVVACHTASSVALVSLRKLRVPVLGVLEPGVRAALSLTRNGRVGVIGTPTTIQSGSYPKALFEASQRQSPNGPLHVYEKACPLFVPLVEEGWVNHPVTHQVVQEYLAPLLQKDVDTLVLGCTHYPLLKGSIQAVVGPQVRLVDSSTETARCVKEDLIRRHLLRTQGSSRPHPIFYVSDAPEKFVILSQRFLGTKVLEVHRIHLER